MTLLHSLPPPWLARLKRAGTAVSDLLFPPQCLVCRAETGTAGALCSPCWETAGFANGAACDRCALPLEAMIEGIALCAGCLARAPAYSRTRAVFRYETARELVLRFKHADRLDYAPAFSAWLHRAGADLVTSADLIVPVPLHRWRLLKRRYNQAAVLAHTLSRRTGLPVLPDSLVRTRPTPSQGEMMSAQARRRNVLAAFAVRPALKARLKDRRVILLDDVMTTGATLEACARALVRAGASDVSALVLARVDRPDSGS